MMINHKEQLLTLLDQALSAVNGRRLVHRYLNNHSSFKIDKVVAIGKAANAMTQGMVEYCNQSTNRLPSGLVISKTEHSYYPLPDCFKVIESGHPVPNRDSLNAGKILLDFLSTCKPDQPILFLISGGSSALVEVLPQQLSLENLQQINQWLLASGLDIAQINQIRKRCSLIKGGGLLDYIKSRTVTALYISDVLNNDPCVIGSGLLCDQPEQTALSLTAVEWLDRLIKEKGKADKREKNRREKQFSIVPEHQIIATLDTALSAAADYAADLIRLQPQLTLFKYSDYLTNDIDITSDYIVNRLIECPPGIHLWGGEVTLRLPAYPRRGGRNQSLALAVAIKLQQKKAASNIVFMAAGTDGTDGSSDDTGAIIDSKTIWRGSLDDLNAQQCLQQANAGEFLQASGDLIFTGPTGTNVMDLYIGLKA